MLLNCPNKDWNKCVSCLLFDICEDKQFNRIGFIPLIIDSIKTAIKKHKREKFVFDVKRQMIENNRQRFQRETEEKINSGKADLSSEEIYDDSGCRIKRKIKGVALK